MKLSVNFVDQGRYWKAGEEIPDDKVPAMIRKYEVRDDDSGARPAPKPSPLANSKSPGKARKPSKG
jgi:hypothetical protein